MKTGMQCAGINQVGHAQLLDITQALKVWMLDIRSNISSVGILIKPYTGSFIIFFLFNAAFISAKM
jgi:hypothetical protein